MTLEDIKVKSGKVLAGNSSSTSLPVTSYNFNKLISFLQENLIDNATSDISVPDGTAALPSISFNSDTDSGFYRIGSNNIGLSLGGTKIVDFSNTTTAFIGAISSTTSITTNTVFRSGAGTVSLPAFVYSGDLDTGIYWIGANNLGIAASGAKVLDISTTGLGITGTLTTSSTITATSAAITAGTTLTAGTIVLTGAGAVGTPSYTFTGQTNMGLYKVSSVQLGVSVSGALVGGFNASGLFTNVIAEQTTGNGITLSQNTVNQHSLTALNSTGTITAAIINKGGITSTSAAGVTATLDTAANIATQISAVNGTSIEFIVDNTAGANTVTVAVAAGITVCSGVVTGSDTLTVSVANAIGIFRLVFSSAAAAKLYRIG